MNRDQEKRISKRLSYILRHAPESIDIVLDSAGWTDVHRLLSQLAKFGAIVGRDDLNHVVANNSKQRFEFSEDCTRIRARQGHSIEIEFEYESAIPPDCLFHGTAERFLEAIMEQGLQKQNRHHVHLSNNRATMIEVGRRHGKPVVLQIDSAAMHASNYEFFVTGNEVWLTDHVPPEFLTVCQ